jgi:regulatory protein
MPRPKPSLKARALRYLAAREHSRLELARKLGRYVEDGDDLEAVLDWLEAQKFLSEERFAESLVNRRAARFGSARILSELQSHGVDEVTVGGLKAELVAGEDDRAWEVWQRKFGTTAADSPEAAKQMRFLQQRGFSHSAIQFVMRRAKKSGTEGA